MTSLNLFWQNAVNSLLPVNAANSDACLPARSVVILCVALLLAVLGSHHPIQIVGEPLAQAAHFRSRESASFFQYRDGADDFHKVDGVNNSGPTSCDYTMNRLGVLKACMHECRRIEKPRS